MKMKAVVKEKELIQDTCIGIYTHITGDMSSEKSIRIDGQVTGNIKALNTVIIGEKAIVKGKIIANTVTIYGQVHGDVEAAAIVCIMKTGILEGDLVAERLVVEEGGVFKGTSKMSSQNQKIQEQKK